MSVAPTILTGRMRTTTYLYDDPDHPDRVTGTVESPAYTAEDTALLQALTLYEAQLCPGCSKPTRLAWHPELDGWWESTEHVCYACTARQAPEPGGEVKQVIYATLAVSADYPHSLDDLPVWEPGPEGG